VSKNVLGCCLFVVVRTGTHALDSYADANRHPLHAFNNGSWVAFPHNLTKAMRRGYYAAVMYTDHNIGMVLDALGESEVKDETVVAVMGDQCVMHLPTIARCHAVCT